MVFPAGRWLTGPIALTSHTTLLLDGARSSIEAVRSMQGWPIQQYKEYPSLPSYAPRKIFRAFVYGYNLTDVTITGGGTIHGHGDFWWPKVRRCRLTSG